MQSRTNVIWNFQYQLLNNIADNWIPIRLEIMDDFSSYISQYDLLVDGKKERSSSAVYIIALVDDWATPANN